MLDPREIRSQIHQTDFHEVTVGADLSNIASAVSQLQQNIADNEAKYTADSKTQKRFNFAMLVFTIVAAVGGLAAAVIAVIGLVQ